MKSEKLIVFLLVVLIAETALIVLQLAGIVSPANNPKVDVLNVEGGSIEVSKGSVNVIGMIDMNLDAVAGYNLVTTESGMYIGVSGAENTVIPINWGYVGERY